MQLVSFILECNVLSKSDALVKQTPLMMISMWNLSM